MFLSIDTLWLSHPSAAGKRHSAFEGCPPGCSLSSNFFELILVRCAEPAALCVCWMLTNEQNLNELNCTRVVSAVRQSLSIAMQGLPNKRLARHHSYRSFFTKNESQFDDCQLQVAHCIGGSPLCPIVQASHGMARQANDASYSPHM